MVLFFNPHLFVLVPLYRYVIVKLIVEC